MRSLLLQKCTHYGRNIGMRLYFFNVQGSPPERMHSLGMAWGGMWRTALSRARMLQLSIGS